MKSVDFEWVVMAIRIQREVGGNLAEVLTTVAATLREREYLRRQVQALSAEGRLSAWILGRPAARLLLYLLLANPTYLAAADHARRSAWSCSAPWPSCSWSACFWMRKVVKVEV